jgi:hypothetical protein
LHSSGVLRREGAKVCFAVIASEAKQSILSLLGPMDCFVAAFLAMTAANSIAMGCLKIESGR